MIETLTKFTSLRPPVRSLVSLYWIYNFVLNFTSVFTQIFLYSRFESLSVNIIAMMFFYTGSMFVFCIFGYVASILKLNIRQAYLWSFFAIACSFVFLLFTHTTAVAYVAMFVSGIGNGFFWLALHTFELVETKNEERDFYSSLLSAGDSALSLLGPGCATVFVWLSGNILHWGAFTLIFIMAPVIYLLGLFFLNTFSTYRPTAIIWHDVSHFFTSKRNWALQLNVAGEAFGDAIEVVVLPPMFLLILGSALNVGLYNTLLGIGSLVCVVAVAHYRKVDNRLAILAFASVATIVALLWLGYAGTLMALIVFGVVTSLTSPLISVSNRAIALRSMESNNRTQVDFYPSMIIRDFSLWMWRMLLGLSFLAVVSASGFERTGLSIGLYLSTIGLIITFIGARIIVTWE